MDSPDVVGNTILSALLKQAKESHLKSKQNAGKKVLLYPTRAEIMANVTSIFAHMEAKRSAASTSLTAHLPARCLP